MHNLKIGCVSNDVDYLRILTYTELLIDNSPSPFRGMNKFKKWAIILRAKKFGSLHTGMGTQIFGEGHNADSHSQ